MKPERTHAEGGSSEVRAMVVGCSKSIKVQLTYVLVSKPGIRFGRPLLHVRSLIHAAVTATGSNAPFSNTPSSYLACPFKSLTACSTRSRHRAPLICRRRQDEHHQHRMAPCGLGCRGCEEDCRAARASKSTVRNPDCNMHTASRRNIPGAYQFLARICCHPMGMGSPCRLVAADSHIPPTCMRLAPPANTEDLQVCHNPAGLQLLVGDTQGTPYVRTPAGGRHRSVSPSGGSSDPVQYPHEPVHGPVIPSPGPCLIAASHHLRRFHSMLQLYKLMDACSHAPPLPHTFTAPASSRTSPSRSRRWYVLLHAMSCFMHASA